MWRLKALTVGRGHADGYQGLRGDGMRSSRRSTVPWHHLSFLLPPALAIVLLFAVSTLTYAIVPPPIIAPIVVAGDPDDPGNPSYRTDGMPTASDTPTPSPSDRWHNTDAQITPEAVASPVQPWGARFVTWVLGRWYLRGLLLHT